MISYAPLQKTMEQRKATTYTLQKNGVSSSSIRRIKDGDSISTNTIDILCEILDCTVCDVIEYLPNK
ncbi:MAG: helix-turn-helix domain-containing protein [Lachnospiraceae bacterium]|nr:helix-turn-helix domain-containing protein [Lachnospiraceae bacterium]